LRRGCGLRKAEEGGGWWLATGVDGGCGGET